MTAARFWTMRTTASVTGSGPGGGGVSGLLAGGIRIEPHAGARSTSGYGRGIVSANWGEVGDRSSQQAARNGLRIFRLQSAARKARTAFDGDPAARLAHPIKRAGAIVGFQRGKRPIGFGKHVDAAFGAYEDGEISGVRGGVGSTLRGVQDGFGVLEEWAHTELIDSVGRISRKTAAKG
jgi:hypothetical protein